jgi:hypothetical protein
MKNSKSFRLPLILSYLSGLIIAIIPFHAFLTVWLASIIDHYTALRLWKEFLLLLVTCGALFLLIRDKQLRGSFVESQLVRAIGLYFLLSLVWGAISYILEAVTLKALGFGLIVNLRFLAFFLAIWVIATKSQYLEKNWPKLLLIPAVAVIIIGLLQGFVLPYDVLKHFGYSSETIFPYQTINNDINYPRIMSTLRGANPLGAYLVLILSTLVIFFIKKINKKRYLWLIFGLAALVALFLSYSRGAWIGLAFSALLLALISIKKEHTRKIFLTFLGSLLILSAILVIIFRNSMTFQNYIFHTNSSSISANSSNEQHITAFKSGLADLVSEPLGRGVGTAGPASVYNKTPRIAENYFIQIGQELGWLGLIVFTSINVLLFRELWFRRSSLLASIILVSFVGLTAINLVSHAWTDDTIAYVFWGLAAVAIATPAVSKDR